MTRRRCSPLVLAIAPLLAGCESADLSQEAAAVLCTAGDLLVSALTNGALAAINSGITTAISNLVQAGVLTLFL